MPHQATDGRTPKSSGFPLRRLTVSIVLFALVLAACGSGSGSTAPSTEPQSAAPSEAASEMPSMSEAPTLSTDTIRIATVTPFNLASVALFGKDQLGTFDGTGLNIEITVATSQTSDLLLETGDVDVALSSPNRPVADITKGLNSRIVAAESLCWGQVVIARAELGATRVEDLKGRTFGISGFGSGGHFATLKTAEAFGWTENDYSVSQLGNRDALVAALKSGAIDAFIWNALEGQNQEALGVGKVLGSVNPYIKATGSVFVVSNDFIENHGDALNAMLTAFFDMQAQIKEDPSAARDVAVSEFEQEPSAVDYVLDDVVGCMDTDGAIPSENLQGIADAALLSNEDLDSVDISQVYQYWRDIP